MPKNPALVPAVVTDVNGRVTTVYRKPGGVSSSVVSVPAPAVLNGDVLRGVLDRMTEVLGLGDRGRHDLRVALKGYSPEFLSWLGPVLEDKTVGRAVAGLVENEYNAPLIRDVVFFRAALAERGHAIPLREVTPRVIGLRRYERFAGLGEFGLEDELVREQCVGLLLVAVALTDESWEGQRMRVSRDMIIDQPLVELVLERPEEAAVIAGLVREHRVSNGLTLRGLLSGVSPSLASGSL